MLDINLAVVPLLGSVSKMVAMLDCPFVDGGGLHSIMGLFGIQLK